MPTQSHSRMTAELHTEDPGAASAAVPDRESTATSPRSRRELLARWLIEGAFIVVSVVLGFAVAEYGEDRDEQELARRVLASLVAEVEHNRALLAPVVPVHDVWVHALADAGTSAPAQSALDVFFATRPPLPPGAITPFPVLRRSSWDAAVAGGALRLIDYETAEALSEIYRMQEIANDNVDRLSNGALSSSATFDPASRAPSVRLLWLTLADIQAAEVLLLALYDKHLPAIRSAAKQGDGGRQKGR